jgi:hypothetical protein
MREQDQEVANTQPEYDGPPSASSPWRSGAVPPSRPGRLCRTVVPVCHDCPLAALTKRTRRAADKGNPLFRSVGKQAASRCIWRAELTRSLDRCCAPSGSAPTQRLPELSSYKARTALPKAPSCPRWRDRTGDSIRSHRPGLEVGHPETPRRTTTTDSPRAPARCGGVPAHARPLGEPSPEPRAYYPAGRV